MGVNAVFSLDYDTCTLIPRRERRLKDYRSAAKGQQSKSGTNAPVVNQPPAIALHLGRFFNAYTMRFLGYLRRVVIEFRRVKKSLIILAVEPCEIFILWAGAFFERVPDVVRYIPIAGFHIRL